MNRRGFFKLAGAALAVAAIPFTFIANKFHRLVGNGITDDTEALRALIRGEKVQMPDGGFQQLTDGIAHLPTGTYKVRELSTNNTTIIGAGVDKTRIVFVPKRRS
jgi:hypothetical protein